MVVCMLGVVAEEVEGVGMAYDYFRRCLDLQPQDPFVLATLGMGLARYDDPDAEGVLRLAAITAPEEPVTRLAYGAFLAREGVADLALEELEAASRLDPDDPRVAREIATAHLLAARRAQGVAELERAVALDAEDAETRLLLGLALLGGERADEAAEEIHRAALELLDDGEAQVAAALASAAREWMDAAWDALARAEGAALAAEPGLLHETEDALEAGAAAADSLLREQVAPRLLHERLTQRP